MWFWLFVLLGATFSVSAMTLLICATLLSKWVRSEKLIAYEDLEQMRAIRPRP